MAKQATFIRPKDVKIWEMCKFIDDHMQEYIDTKNPYLEDTIVQYLYHILDSLAKKQSFFPNFEDYDEFALYGAGELFVSIRNKYMNAGTIKRGKVVEPVKNTLNYVKSVLYPLKVNFTKTSFDCVINPKVGHNTEKLTEDMRESIRQQYRTELIEDIKEVMKVLTNKIKKILSVSPYRNDPVMLKRIYLSVVLSFINQVTLPNKMKNKINTKTKPMEQEKISNIYSTNDYDILLWHLPEHMKSYIRILLVRAKRAFSDELIEYRTAVDLSDEVIDGIMATAFTTYDQDMEDYK